jgi:hypothetical protein
MYDKNESQLIKIKANQHSEYVTNTCHCTAFQNEYPDGKISTRQAIYQLAKKFDETGSIDDAPCSTRLVTAKTEENRQRFFR